MKRRAIYPGSFDPITYGHLDVAERALTLFDEVIIAVARNAEKKPLFTIDERMEIIRGAVKKLAKGGKLKVTTFDGLLVNFAQKQKACAVVRGLRAVSDFEYELQLALTNRKLAPSVETIFLTPRENHIYLSSNMIKEIAKLKGRVECFVPPNVKAALEKKFF
ncbi:MAG: pantetheine-phosphate adenylyltransferase [Verrucomicrobiota bacterium]